MPLEIRIKELNGRAFDIFTEYKTEGLWNIKLVFFVEHELGHSGS